MMEATAIHDFLGDGVAELGFAKGNRLLVLNLGASDHLWFEAEMNGRKGLIPGNYITIEPVDWYYGRITRSEAECMLESNINEGAFLVRLSESSPTDFSLSVKCKEAVQHFRILKDNDRKYFLWSTRFNSLNELVDHYRTETVSRTYQLRLRDLTADNQFVVKAIYDFEPREEEAEEEVSELGFLKGEIITVFDSQDDNWWGGRIRDKSGYFPRTYVEPIEPVRQPSDPTT